MRMGQRKISIIRLLTLSFVTALSIFLVGSGHVSAADVNSFTIPGYTIDYTLSRDSEGRSTLRTVETIDAVFPTFDQNHGIERALPTTYDGHTTDLRVVSVTDDTNRSREYSTYESNGNLVLRIGSPDTYAHGAQRYKITYTQGDVTSYFADTNSDEFYWDTNGTDWRVPINNLSVNLRIQDALRARQTNRQHCYRGAISSMTPCDLYKTSDGYSLAATNLKPGQNITLAVGFQPKTFAAYQQSLTEKLLTFWLISFLVTLSIALVLIVWFSVRYYRKTDRVRERTTIIPEYIPPKDISVAAAAQIHKNTKVVFAAQLIDFAVRGYLKIYQTTQKSFFRKAQYELEIIKDIAALKDEERELLSDIFPATSISSRLALKDLKHNTSIYAKLSDNPGKLSKSIKGDYGLRAKLPQQSAWFKRASLYTLLAAILTLSPWLLMVAIVAFVYAYMLWPLTDKGLALWHYLEGLKLYITVAERDRIKMLQGPDTAEKLGAPIDTNDTRQLVKLYEQTLPYAILFGLEKDWNRQLGQYYESLGESPGWFAGNNTVFNAAVLSSAMSSFNSAATYSNPASSSSGGSGGGGFSGGGGGGGGGGGW